MILLALVAFLSSSLFPLVLNLQMIVAINAIPFIIHAGSDRILSLNNPTGVIMLKNDALNMNFQQKSEKNILNLAL